MWRLRQPHGSHQQFKFAYRFHPQLPRQQALQAAHRRFGGFNENLYLDVIKYYYKPINQLLALQPGRFYPPNMENFLHNRVRF